MRCAHRLFVIDVSCVQGAVRYLVRGSQCDSRSITAKDPGLYDLCPTWQSDKSKCHGPRKKVRFVWVVSFMHPLSACLLLLLCTWRPSSVHTRLSERDKIPQRMVGAVHLPRSQIRSRTCSFRNSYPKLKTKMKYPNPIPQ